MKEKNKMAYTSSDAIKTFFDYLGITKNNVYVIPDTKNRGIVYKNKNGEDCVIFISPISYSSYNDKGFFDTRDSGPKERITTWNYAVQKNLKYFNVAVQGIVEKYKNYIFSLECNEDRIQLVSGSSNVERRATNGTQIVIGRNCLTDKKFERFKTEYGFFIADIYKDYFEEYIVTFDNRPYTQKLEQIHFDDNDNIENEESITLNYTPFSEKDKIKFHNRIIFGAPGTGKSHRLKSQCEEFFSSTINPKTLSDDERANREIQNAKNDYSASFAIGLKYADFFKNIKQAKEISNKYDCGNKSYTIYQGIRAKQFFDSLPEIDSNDDEEKIFLEIKRQLEKLGNEKYLLQAGAAAIGFKYADFLRNKTKSELNEIFNLKNTTSESGWIKIGVQASNYIMDETFFQKSTRHYERVTFHPNYSYSQFVGCYKPSMKTVSTDDGEKEEITYSFVPGPFLHVYVNAIKNPAENFLLLIEEINRANVAAVFGDVFQLLDRKQGKSEYPVTASEDIIKYLRSEGINKTELSIPENMYIWATMNSADQGVFPMDTAFKRRWNFEYIGINDNENGVSTYEIPINKSKKVNWNDLRKAINSKLISLNVNEDKLLGPYFISENDLKNAMGKPEDFIKLFKSKVLMYLFEDAAKMKRDFFKLTDNRKYIYSDICNELDENGIAIFNFLENEKVEEKDIPEKVQNGEEKIVGSGPTMTENTKIDSPASPQNGGTN